MQFQSLGWEDPLEYEMVPHSTILAWKIPWAEEPGGLQRVCKETRLSICILFQTTMLLGIQRNERWTI